MSVAERVVAETLRWLDTPYHHQAALRGVGCDCLGLVRGVYDEVLGRPTEPPPPYSASWAEATPRGQEDMLDAARRYLWPQLGPPWSFQPGDVLVFRYRPTASAKHAGIVVAPDEMVHSYNRVGVKRVSIVPYWTSKIAGVFSFPEE